MRKIFYSLVIATSIVAAQEIDSILDEYHIKISKWVMDKSDVIDRFLSGVHDEKSLSNTKIKVAYEVGVDDDGDFSNSFDFSLSLHLPRFKDKALLTLEKVTDNDTFIRDKEALLTKKDMDLNDNYNLAFKLSRVKTRDFSINATGGVRFGKNIIEPYIGLILDNNFIHSKKVEFNINNTVRYYLAGEIRDVLSTQYLYNFKKNIVLGWLGTIDYSNEESEQTLTSEFIWHKRVNDYKFYRFGFIADAKLRNFKHFRKNNFEVYFKYHDKYKDKKWLFYEITPFIDWKKEDDYKTTFGMKLKVGATFGGIRDLLKRGKL